MPRFSNSTLKCIQKFEVKKIYIKEKILIINNFLQILWKKNNHKKRKICYIKYWKPMPVHLLEKPFKSKPTYFRILHLCRNVSAFGYTSWICPLIAHVGDLLGSTLISKELACCIFPLQNTSNKRKWEGTGMWLTYSWHEARMQLGGIHRWKIWSHIEIEFLLILTKWLHIYFMTLSWHYLWYLDEQ